jgi:hypothetical protein
MRLKGRPDAQGENDIMTGAALKAQQVART